MNIDKGFVLELMIQKKFWTFDEILKSFNKLRTERNLIELGKGSLRRLLSSMLQTHLKQTTKYYSLRTTEPDSWRIPLDQFDENLFKKFTVGKPDLIQNVNIVLQCFFTVVSKDNHTVQTENTVTDSVSVSANTVGCCLVRPDTVLHYETVQVRNLLRFSQRGFGFELICQKHVHFPNECGQFGHYKPQQLRALFLTVSV